MEWWWLLITVPLYSIWQALREAWYRLLEAGSDDERQQIMTQAGARAFINTMATFGIAAAPWPYKLLGLIPAFFPAILNGAGTVLGIMFNGKYQRRF